MSRRSGLAVIAGAALLSACGGGGGGGIVSPPPPAAQPPVPAPPPPPLPPQTFDSAEYRRSNGAVQARAVAAYSAGATGAGVTVGVVDSGIATMNGEFGGRISPLSLDLVGNRGLQDEGGHGTSVTNVLLGAKNDSGIHGIAFDATLLVLRADTIGSCASSTADEDKCRYSDNAIARGLDRAVSANARVVNLSLGGTPANATLRAAVGRATAAGVIVVISAGNDFETDPALGANPDELAQLAREPASRGLVLIAGATDATRTITPFSNRAGNASAFYLTALGDRVRSIDQTGAGFLFSGTSLSTPLVSGAVALLAQAFPTLTPRQIVDLLLRTATDLGAPGVDPVYGHGELNLESAFAPQGAMTVAGQRIALADNAVLGSAMGDAGAETKGGLLARVRDGYGRGYTLDLAPTIRAASRQLRLAPALSLGPTSLVAARGPTVFALALDGGWRIDQPGFGRPVAGSMATAIGGGRAVAFGVAHGSAGLVRSLDGDRDAALLIAARGDADLGFARLPAGAVAVRQAAGRVALTLAVEQGSLHSPGITGRRTLETARLPYASAGARSQAQLGPVRLLAGVTRLDETETILGGRFAAGLGGGGAVSWFGDAGVSLVPAAGWRVGGILRRGRTQLAGGPVRAASALRTRALSIDAERSWPGGAIAALRWSEPLRVTRGGLDLAGYDEPARLDLAPRGHERDLEASYAHGAGGGRLTANAYWRQQPGNDRRVPDDHGLALRFSRVF